MEMDRRWLFAELTSVRRETYERFEDFMRHSLFFAEAAAPASNAYQTINEVVVKPAMPGLKSEDIGIDIIGNTLTINREDKAK